MGAACGAGGFCSRSRARLARRPNTTCVMVNRGTKSPSPQCAALIQGRALSLPT